MFPLFWWIKFVTAAMIPFLSGQCMFRVILFIGSKPISILQKKGLLDCIKRPFLGYSMLLEAIYRCKDK